MTQITIEIPKEQDLDTLLALLRQMNLRVVNRKVSVKNEQATGQTAASIKKQFLSKPARQSFDKEAIKEAQKWKGQHDKVAMLQILKDMDVQEPIEKLLSQLSR